VSKFTGKMKKCILKSCIWWFKKNIYIHAANIGSKIYFENGSKSVSKSGFIWKIAYGGINGECLGLPHIGSFTAQTRLAHAVLT